jgi:hypothetical protein
MPTDEFEYDVALSFAAEDKDIAYQFAEHLKLKGVSVFLDEYQSAELWGKDMVDHLVNLYSRKARLCVLLVSRHYPLKTWTDAERTAAQERSLRDASEYILPLRLDDTQVSGMEDSAGYRDLRQHSVEEVVSLLVQKLEAAKAKSSPLPKSHDLRSGSVSSAKTEE